MSAIKFSKQFIEPNPQEVDYWVDISTNPYGGVIKYYNGETWAVLTSPDGTPINMDAFYNKLQINQMLATKASVESVESKVDDTELSDLMNNIEFKGKDGNGVDMIIFKYDGTNVGITLPTASNTTAGIITKDQFKDLVKLNQLQSLYSEMYSKVTEIYLKFQKKLKAGKNIKIDETTNTIHATGKISTDWNDLTNVPDIDGAIQAEADRAKAEEAKLSARITDHVEVVEGKLDLKADKSDIYTKDQVDEKVASVYKIIGSSTFEELPTEGNTIGDVYNITNDFTLNGIEYPFGTNVVWTADGWDTLSGVFDTTELEGLVEGVDTKIDEEIVRAKAKELELDEKFDGYLPLRGGLLTNELTGLFINRTANNLTAHITFLVNGVSVGDIGVSHLGNPVAYDYSTKKWNHLLHSNNYSNYALPLSGGTITEGLLTIKRQPAMIRYTNYADQTLGYIGFGDDANKPRFTMSDGTTNYMLWHEGNDGEGSGLNADMLDGKHNGELTATYVKTHGRVTSLNNVIKGDGTIRYYLSSSSTTEGKPKTDGTVLHFGWDNNLSGGFGSQLFLSTDEDIMQSRYCHNSTWSPWKTIAFTDSDITGNAATATKLATPVKLWGNDFDGSTYIDGDIGSTKSDFTIHASNTELINLSTTGAYVNLAYGAAAKQYNTYVYGKDIRFKTNATTSVKMIIANNGNVGIGIADPLYKLHVNGGGRFDDHIIVNGIIHVGTLNSMSASNDAFIIGYGHTKSNKTTYLDGYKLLFRYGEGHSNGMNINESGNVTIGSSDLAGSDYKLHVSGKAHAMFNYSYAYYVYNNNRTSVSRIATGENGVYFQAMDINGISNQGNIHITGYNGDTLNSMTIKAITTTIESNNTIVNNNLSVDNKITSGDYVDWYGVSWSEDSSDPTCTRIGNMALHRSLPILSAMKGYFISNINSDVPESIIPMNGTWSGTNFSTTGNDAIAVEDSSNGSVMVKIPEFWYIDEYESSTKTHNLKISQTAKAGWCHHKEAYVGAYEGYSDGVTYRSARSKFPTVSVSRTTLRPLARANGYEDEYKWNIYTYEEHRAICHLFLVEYATRNSQLAVNTALTSDGFKQGGLGSGCTTGTVTINGVTTYSFIPTGTTNSLGNGSGQVAYTVTLTDADGNETGTVTRYANRYRGIENPFGHIWKYVDDIVNIYNAETTYKTVYKCNKPEHFATNKNAKYKPLCSLPDGSKMLGWSKEIKATINCDFFKYSIDGSESTHWCDYNYDSNDTLEHCLSIGGRSNEYGGAGLFCFNLANAVGYSNAGIGSRLTYLPWAE